MKPNIYNSTYLVLLLLYPNVAMDSDWFPVDSNLSTFRACSLRYDRWLPPSSINRILRQVHDSPSHWITALAVWREHNLYRLRCRYLRVLTRFRGIWWIQVLILAEVRVTDWCVVLPLTFVAPWRRPTFTRDVTCTETIEASTFTFQYLLAISRLGYCGAAWGGMWLLTVTATRIRSSGSWTRE